MNSPNPQEKPQISFPVKPVESFQKKEEYSMPKIPKKTYTPYQWNEFFDTLEYLDDVNNFI